MNELEQLADQLLKVIPRDPSAPHYLTERFDDKLRLQNRHALRRPWHSRGLIPGGVQAMSLSVVEDLIVAAELTRPQFEVLTLVLTGHNFSEIGQVRKHSKQGAHRIWRQALAKMRRVL